MPLRPEDIPGANAFPRLVELLQHNVSAIEATCADYEHMLELLRKKEAAAVRKVKRSQQREIESKAEEIDRILEMAKRVRVSPMMNANFTRVDGAKGFDKGNAKGLHVADRPQLSVSKTIKAERRKLQEQADATSRAKASLMGKIDAYLQLLDADKSRALDADVVPRMREVGVSSRDSHLLRLALYKQYLDRERSLAMKAFQSYDSGAATHELTAEERITRLFPVWFKLNFIAEEEKLLALAYTRAGALNEGNRGQPNRFKPLLERWNKDIAAVATEIWKSPNQAHTCKQKACRLVDELRKETSLRCLEIWGDSNEFAEILGKDRGADEPRIQRWARAMLR